MRTRKENELYKTDEDGNRLCKKCKYTKPQDNFYKCPKHTGGFMYMCKCCFRTKDRSTINVNPTPKYKTYLRDLPEVKMPRMTQCSKQDYLFMYEFLRRVGYDPNQNIALQFSERHGTVYQERKKLDQNLYLPDGNKNPLHRSVNG
jgi:hypothetical protein